MHWVYALFLLTWGFPNALNGSSVQWHVDYNKAVHIAKKEQKPLLLFFTGSDWSGWGMKMKREIIDSPSFQEKVADSFVCALIDFPKYKSQSKEEIAQNALLKEKNHITDYPRLVLLDPEEREIARLGYSSEGGGQLAETLLQTAQADKRLTKILETFEQTVYTFSELEDLYRQAQELKRIPDAQLILERGLKSESPLFFLLEKYRLLVEEGKRQSEECLSLRKQLLEIDPQNNKKVHFSLALIDFQALVDENKKDLRAIKPLEEYVARFGDNDEENIWSIEMMIAQFYLQFDECQKALKHAETAYERAPQEMKEEIGHSLEYIRKEAKS